MTHRNETTSSTKPMTNVVYEDIREIQMMKEIKVRIKAYFYIESTLHMHIR